MKLKPPKIPSQQRANTCTNSKNDKSIDDTLKKTPLFLLLPRADGVYVFLLPTYDFFPTFRVSIQ